MTSSQNTKDCIERGLHVPLVGTWIKVTSIENRMENP